MGEAKKSLIAKGPLRALRALKFSWAGLKAAWRHEEAFRQEIVISGVLLPAAFWLGESGVEKALLCAVVFLVLITEVLNSAVEAVVDRFGPELHDLAGRAKDLGSAAVFLALLNAGVVWILILTG